MFFAFESYLVQNIRWPTKGRFILGHFDEESIIVYQAFPHDIANFATKHGYLGGNFRLNRMSWIKPNFLWMMYRSGWATKPGQEHVLAIKISRTGFETILQQAVHSHYVPELYTSQAIWKGAMARSDVRLQWDPDHDPVGKRVERRAVQLGLRGETLRRYAKEWIVEINDITDFVHEQYQFVQASKLENLLIPVEEIYPIEDTNLHKKLRISGI